MTNFLYTNAPQEAINWLKQALAAKIEKGINNVAVIEFAIEHITGKEAIELVKQRN